MPVGSDAAVSDDCTTVSVSAPEVGSCVTVIPCGDMYGRVSCSVCPMLTTTLFVTYPDDGMS